jgi:outer membrane protein TolC
LIGTSGEQPRELFRSRPLTLLAPMLSWSFLDIPGTRARVAGAEADRDEALGEYERTVVEALQDANDSLARYGRMRNVLVERQGALDAAGRAASLIAQRAERGTASHLDALDAERERLASEDRSAQALSDYMQAYVSLQKSLGLGW